MDGHEEVLRLRNAIDALDRPIGKLIAAASDEYWLCLGGMRRAEQSGNKAMFSRWANVMHRIVPAIAENPPERYVRELARLSR
jgi:hypothetical protein